MAGGKANMKIGILGHGSIGKRHGINLLNLGQGYQVLWYEPNERDLCSRESIINWSDAIVVASPTKQHMLDFQDAIDLGKHVFVEKPLVYDAPPPLIAGYWRDTRRPLHSLPENREATVSTGRHYS